MPADRLPDDGRIRCDWGRAWADPLYRAYHDEDWGVPMRDERALYELLCLEGAQAGLSWIMILRKRETYRAAFEGWDPERVARYDAADVARLLADPGIVRNRLKVQAAIANARAVLALRASGAGFPELLWSFVGGTPRINRWTSTSEVPAETQESRAMSRELGRRGFRFVGPTICYAFMQSAGLVNDHQASCFRWAEVQRG